MLCLISLEWIFSSIFLLLYMVTILGLCVVIIAENRNPLKTIPWVVAVLLAPGIGLLFYLFFGQDNRKQRIISRRTYKRIMKRPHTERILQDACNLPPEYQSLATLLRNNNRASLLYGSRLEVFTDGKAKFEALLRDLRGARRYIHIEYYIFCDDRVGIINGRDKIKHLRNHQCLPTFYHLVYSPAESDQLQPFLFSVLFSVTVKLSISIQLVDQ